MESLVLMMQRQMQQQMKQQMQVMEQIRLLSGQQHGTPETPVLQTRNQQPTPSPSEKKNVAKSPSPSEKKNVAKSPLRRSPRLKSLRVAKLEPSPLKPSETKIASRQLKRTLSYDKALRAGARKQKSQKMRMLRKMLSGRLSVLEPDFLSGEFHNEHNKFLEDEFFEAVSPIVYAVTGPPEDCSDEELPGVCLKMAKDIMRKRKQYEEKKNGK